MCGLTSPDQKKIAKKKNSLVNTWWEWNSKTQAIAHYTFCSKSSNLFDHNFRNILSRLNHVQLFATLWTVACQAPLSMGFSKQEC